LKISRTFGGLLALILVASGCERVAPEEGPVRVADPQRVVALAPSLVEMLYVLELGDRLVGVGEYCTFPPEAALKPRIGGLFNPDPEAITRLDPEIAILMPSEEQLRVFLEGLGIEVMLVASESIADIESAAVALAERFNVPERGAAFVESWQEALAPQPLRHTPRVLLAVARQRGSLADTLSAGPGTFYDELLTRMGAINVFADAAILYPEANLEEAMQRLPEAIVDLQPRLTGSREREMLAADWLPLAGVPALERGCHIVLGGDYVMLPGPRVPRLFTELRAALEACGY
jgi:iron complex transport system substrate-binding protein